MKPLYLKMTAFGSYQEAEIDFTAVDHGLFLITGDTGSGKTTIFDAMTFALFDETSGGQRNGEMMRSQYARPDVITEVQFRFLYHDEVYTVIRKPRQTRYKKIVDEQGTERYEKLKTLFGPEVELILPDGSIYPGKKPETDRKIKDIIGLEASQFTQIAMLAQGDFLKLLHASSKERMQIFAKIFDTRIYRIIEELLQQWAKSSGEALAQNREAIEREMERFQCMERSQYAEAFAGSPKFSESAQEELLALAEQIVLEAEQHRAALETQLQADEKELEQLQQMLHGAEVLNRLFEQCAALKQEQQQLAAQQTEMAQLAEKLAVAEKAALVQTLEREYQDKKREQDALGQQITALQQQIGAQQQKTAQLEQQAEEQRRSMEQEEPALSRAIMTIEANLPQYAAYESAWQQRQQCSRQGQERDQQLQQCQQQLEQQLNQLEQDQAQRNSLEAQLEPVDMIGLRIERLEERKTALTELIQAQQQLEQLKRNGTVSRRSQQQAQQQWQQQQEHYQQRYQIFLDSQAAILAENLQEGQPCPVCGSVHHIRLARQAGQLVDNEAIKQEHSLLEQKEAIYRQETDKLTAVIQEYRAKAEAVNQTGRKVLGDSFDAAKWAPDEIEKALLAVQQQLADEQQKKTQAERRTAQLASCKQQIQQREQTIQQQRELLQTLTEQKQQTDVQLAALKSQLASMKQQLQHADKQAAEQELTVLQRKLQTLKRAQQTAEQQWNQARETLSQLQGNLHAREGSLKDTAAKCQQAQRLWQQGLKQQGFDSEAAYWAAVMEAEARQAGKAALEQYQQQVTANKAQLQTVQSSIQGQQSVDVSLYQEKIAARKRQIEINRQTSTVLYNLIAVDRQALKQVQDLYEQRKTLHQQYILLSNLDNTANGRLAGKHMKFQTYIQRRYFKKIIENANRRLYTMSNHQFILQCRDLEDLGAQGQVGLDLDVYSIVNDQTRDVKTLSGGESFMAALAMALGMADFIQHTAGKVHIDAMFVDEGFGSLSEETRNQAIAILNELSEGKRLVGIISHVSELKAQIENKLVVSKTEKGSSVRWELTN
mgnify:CR=1 FL=1